ncbi:PIN domain-containing protein [Pirellulales bacterium]|nr:PIN domain-containing protein [Pirellulales bacterium]
MPGQKILIDTGPLVAILDADDPAHEKCVEAFRSLPAPNYTCWPVLTEACYLLRKFPNAVAALLDEVADGDLIALPLEASDVAGIRQTFDTYHDQQVDLADACLVHLANREGIDQVFTLDRRHFLVFQTADGKVLGILPD